MTYEGYLQLGGTEIISNARTRAYCLNSGINYGSCDPCADAWYFKEAICEKGEEYTNPCDDDAPWVDEGRPESWRFLGVFGLSVSGLDSAFNDRQPQALTGDGSNIGRARRPHREISWQVALIGLDEAALSYGREYLAAALRSVSCGTSAAGGACGGEEMCFFASCPCEPDCNGCAGDAEHRTLYDVGLLEGPSADELVGIGVGDVCSSDPYYPDRCLGVTRGAMIQIMTFVLVAGRPHIFHNPVRSIPVCTNLSFGDTLTGFDPDKPTCLRVNKPCTTDPACDPPRLPPQPPPPVDPCFKTGPFNAKRSWLHVGIVRDPTSPAEFARRPHVLPAWLETVPVMTVYAGNKPLRRLTVRFISNPADLDCDNTDPCGTCFEVTLNYLPAKATLHLDGRLEQAWVECAPGAAGERTARPTLYGPAGAAFSWPVFSCPTGFCVEIIAQDDVDGCAAAEVVLYPRADAT